MKFQKLLSQHSRYFHEFEKLHQKHLYGGRLYTIKQNGISLANFCFDQKKVAKLLSKAIAREKYELEPAEKRIIYTGQYKDKKRIVYSVTITDMVVHGVIAGIINEVMDPLLSSRLFSFRKGITWQTPITQFASYIKSHGKTDLKSKGIYVIRGDVESYGDNIPLGKHSRIWQLIKDVFKSQETDLITGYQWSLIEKVSRIEVEGEKGDIYSLIKGVPTGLPMTTVLDNIYLMPLDKICEKIPGGFYARYGDDIIFAHPDPKVVQEADITIRNILSDFKLGVSDKKYCIYHLSLRGNTSKEWPGTINSPYIPYLGCNVWGKGTISLDNQKVNRLLKDLKHRAVKTFRTLKKTSPEIAGPMICSVINRALQPKTAFSQQRSASLLRRAVTDRNQLKHIDYCIAKIVLYVITKNHSAKMFRQYSYKTIRCKWKLISLFHARNMWRKSKYKNLEDEDAEPVDPETN